MQPTDNTILITGGGSGIGRGLAEAFHALGNQVIISGRGQKNLDDTVAANPGMQAMTVDMSSADGIRDFAAKLTAAHPKLNVLINNAGIMRVENLVGPADDPAAAEEMIATNLLGPIRLTAALMPVLRQQPHATVINVTSGLAFVPLSLTPTYCATKAAIHSYSQSLRYQLKDTAVQVIELAPPYVQTTLMGAHQASDPTAMPLTDLIQEVMHLLTTTPEANEILVQRVRPLRFAGDFQRDDYDAFVRQFNDLRTEQLKRS